MISCKLPVKLTLRSLRQDQRNSGIAIMSTLAKAASSKTVEKKSTKAEGAKKSAAGKKDKPVDASKFEIYYDFRSYANNIQPHQILALNRGESLKVGHFERGLLRAFI